MKKQLKYVLSTAGLIAALLVFVPKDANAFDGTTRYNPCVCYTYFTDGHIEVGESCDNPIATGICAKIQHCLPKNEEDRLL